MFDEATEIILKMRKSTEADEVKKNLAIKDLIEIVYVLRNECVPPYSTEVKRTLETTYLFLAWFAIPELAPEERSDVVGNVRKKLLDRDVPEEFLGTQEHFLYVLLRALEIASNEDKVRELTHSDKSFKHVCEPARKKLKYYRAALGK